jgi:hypothetical protein
MSNKSVSPSASLVLVAPIASMENRSRGAVGGGKVICSCTVSPVLALKPRAPKLLLVQCGKLKPETECGQLVIEPPVIRDTPSSIRIRDIRIDVYTEELVRVSLQRNRCCCRPEPHRANIVMRLLELPAEIRLQILEYLPGFLPGRTETIGPNVRLTPAICRTCSTLRREGLPLFASTAFFIIQTDDLHLSSDRVSLWLDALDGKPLSQVRGLQLSRHWNISQPARWQGHVGFYIRLQSDGKQWQCTTGTYPIANDIRGMRLESTELLRHVITERLKQMATDGQRGLGRADVEVFLRAMSIIASHPISTFDTEQSETGRKRRRETWDRMELQMSLLNVGSSKTCSPFFTPY